LNELVSNFLKFRKFIWKQRAHGTTQVQATLYQKPLNTNTRTKNISQTIYAPRDGKKEDKHAILELKIRALNTNRKSFFCTVAIM